MRALALILVASCAPSWEDDPARVAAAQIVAVQASPPEAAPGQTVILTAIVATPEGPAAPDVAWAFCASPKPLAENGAVNAACVTGDLAALASAPSVETTVPADACRLFGPETPPRVGTAPPVRPRDPDATGGYYQPVRAAGVGPIAIASIRIACNLATAPLEVAAELRRRYAANRNPAPPEITALVDGAPAPLDALPPGPVTLVARWAPESAEPYLAFDPASQSIAERRESMRVSWLVTAGTLSAPRASRGERDLETTATTGWEGEGAHLWVVLQDSRGGVAVSYRALSRQALRPDR